MNKLLIEKRGNAYFVQCDDVSLERQCLDDVLEDTFITPAYRSVAVRYISAIFNVLNAERVALGGDGDWWVAEAEVRRERLTFIDAEGDNPVGALASLIIATVLHTY